jgi:hypothetical protein
MGELGAGSMVIQDTLANHVRPSAEEQPQRQKPRYARRLSDKILIALHSACDQRDLEVASMLLAVLDMMSARTAQMSVVNRRRDIGALVAAHERLWILRHPNGLQPDDLL